MGTKGAADSGNPGEASTAGSGATEARSEPGEVEDSAGKPARSAGDPGTGTSGGFHAVRSTSDIAVEIGWAPEYGHPNTSATHTRLFIADVTDRVST